MERHISIVLLYVFNYIVLNCIILLLISYFHKVPESTFSCRLFFFHHVLEIFWGCVFLLLCCCRMFVRVWPDLKVSCCCSFVSFFFNLMHILLQQSCRKQQNKPTYKQVFFHCWWSRDEVTQVTRGRHRNQVKLCLHSDKNKDNDDNCARKCDIFRRVQTLTREPNWR